MTRRRKLTKARARKIGRKGGKATLARYGPEHFSDLGKLGFAALAAKLGFQGGGRRGALQQLIGSGKIRLGPAEERAQSEAEDFFEQFWRDFDPDNPGASK